MKIHQMLVNELLTQAEFRSLFLEYARERVGEASLLPVSEWPYPGNEAPAPVPVPVATGWRAMVAREVIREGDQWAPLSDPERWRPVGDSVGKLVGTFKKSRFRCDAAREVVEGLELGDSQPVYVFDRPTSTSIPREAALFSLPPAPENPAASYVRGCATEGLTEYTDVEMRRFELPSGAILWNGDDVPGVGIIGYPASFSFNAGERNSYAGVTRPYLYAVTSEGRRSTAGDGYRILWPDEQLQLGDEFGNDALGWAREFETDHASGDFHFTIKVHRRRIEWGSVPVAPRGETCDVVMIDEPVNVSPATPDAYPRFHSALPEGFALLPRGEIVRGGDRWHVFDSNGELIWDGLVINLIGSVAGESSTHTFFRPIPVAPLPEDDDWMAEPPTPLFRVPTHVGAMPPPPVAPSDAERRRSWRELEPHEVVVEGDRYANPHNNTDMCVIDSQYGITAGDRNPRYPVIRPIVTERLDPNGITHTARLVRRFLDPEETTPSDRWTVYPIGVTEQGVRAGDRIIEVTIREVENA